MALCTAAANVPLARGGAGQADVHWSCSRATFDPVASQNKTQDQADFLSFSVKRAFQNEILSTPPDRDLRRVSAACAGPSLALLQASGPWRAAEERIRAMPSPCVATYAHTRRTS
jgi:hypothetical protein